MHRIFPIVGVTLAMGLVANVAAAADNAPKAEGAFRAGVSLFNHKEYDAAAREFERAYEASQQEKYLWNLALSELGAGRYWPAYQHFLKYKSDPDATAENLIHVDDVLASDESHLGHLNVEAPGGATVSVDGEVQGVAPLSRPIVVDPDRDHDVRVDRGLYQQAMHITAVGANVTSVKFEPAPPSPAPTPGAAAVPIDTPPPAQGPPRIARGGSNAARNIATVAALGLVAISAGIGVGYYFAAQNDRDLAQAIHPRLDAAAARIGAPPNAVCAVSPTLPDCVALADANAREQNNATLEDVFFIAAGGLAVAGAAVFLVWPKARAGTSAWVRPQVEKDGATLVLGGAF